MNVVETIMEEFEILQAIRSGHAKRDPIERPVLNRLALQKCIEILDDDQATEKASAILVKLTQIGFETIDGVSVQEGPHAL